MPEKRCTACEYPMAWDLELVGWFCDFCSNFELGEEEEEDGS